MPKIPIELKNAIIENDLVIFVGAGLSYDLKNSQNQKLKGWNNLVFSILEDLENKNYDVNHLKSLVEIYDAIQVLNLIELNKTIPKREIYKCVKSFFELDSNNNLELHKNLFKLSSRIITTNYDTAFEEAVPLLRKHKAYAGKNYELTTHKEKDSILLFKLHGCAEDSESMILFPSNYKNLYENNERDAQHSLFVLRNLVVNKTILFIGSGMGDFQINNIFNEIKKLQGDYNQNHFIISNKALDSSLDFLTRIEIKDFKEIDIIVNELLIIKEEARNNRSPNEILLEKQLNEAIKTIEELKDTSDKDKLLEREALKYFSSGVKFSMNNEHSKACFEYKIAIELDPKLQEAYYNLATNLGIQAQNTEGKEAEELYNQAFLNFQKATELNHLDHESYTNWGIDLCNCARTKKKEEAEKLFDESFKKFQKSIDIKPHNDDAFNNWGIGLGLLAKISTTLKRDQYYAQSFKKFEKAISISPNKHECYNNWGCHLGNYAETKLVDEAERIYNQAFEKFETSIKLEHYNHKAYFNWGNNLCKLATIKNDGESERLYQTAFENFEKAIEIKPQNHELYFNWGTYLADFAITKDGEESEDLFCQAFEKLRRSIEIKPNQYEAHFNMGTLMVNLAEIKKDKEAEDLLIQSFKYFFDVIEKRPDFDLGYQNLLASIEKLNKIKQSKESEEIYIKTIETLQKVILKNGYIFKKKLFL